MLDEIKKGDSSSPFLLPSIFNVRQRIRLSLAAELIATTAGWLNWRSTEMA
jgi:hypothetical protein